MLGSRRRWTSVAPSADGCLSSGARTEFWFAGAFAAALLGVASPAAADPSIGKAPPSAALSWVRAPGAEECPAGPVVGAEVERVLAGPTLAPIAQADLVIEGRVAPLATGFETTLTLTLRNGSVLGTRKLVSTESSCAAITREVALVIALMIDPEAALRPAPRPPPTPDPGLSPGAPSAPTPCPSPLPPAAFPDKPRPWSVHFAAGPVVGLGLLPDPGFGVRVRAAITPPGLFPLEIGAELFTPVRAGSESQGVEIRFAQAFGRACPLAVSRGAWDFAGCAGVDLGSVRGAGFGFPVNRAAELLVVAAALGGRLGLHLGGVVVASAGADLAIPFLRGRFFYNAAGGEAREAFLTAPVAGTLDLAIGVQLP